MSIQRGFGAYNGTFTKLMGSKNKNADLEAKMRLTWEQTKKKNVGYSPAGEHTKAHRQSSWGAKVKKTKMRPTGEQKNRKTAAYSPAGGENNGHRQWPRERLYGPYTMNQSWALPNLGKNLNLIFLLIKDKTEEPCRVPPAKNRDQLRDLKNG